MDRVVEYPEQLPTTQNNLKILKVPLLWMLPVFGLITLYSGTHAWRRLVKCNQV